MNIKGGLIIIMVCLGLQTVCFSQTEQFKLFVGGNANFKSNNSSTTHTGSTLPSSSEFYNFNISPKGGVFVIKNLALGVSADINYANYYAGSQINKTFTVGPLARYYFKIKKCAIFLEADYNYGKGYVSYKASYSFSSSEMKLNAYSGGAGFTYFPKENVGLELMYQFRYINETITYVSPNYYLSIYYTNPNSTVVQQEQNVNIGLLFYF